MKVSNGRSVVTVFSVKLISRFFYAVVSRWALISCLLFGFSFASAQAQAND